MDSPQSWNRYSYVLNSPINFKDPTGHDPWWNDSFFYLDTYVTAGIYQQSSCLCNLRGAYTWLSNDPYLSRGPAAVKDIERSTDRGVGFDADNNGKKPRGYGLGLPNINPEIMKDAKLAMAVRIALRLKECTKAGCSATDEVVVAALAANDSIRPEEIVPAFKNKSYFSADGTFDWLKYLTKNEAKDQERDRKVLLKKFVEHYDNKDSRPSVNWNNIQGLINAK